jgi:anti-sigma regulatory factor (Ser/Thr protein kinase)
LKITFLFLYFQLGVFLLLSAQQPITQQYTTNEGLPSNEVYNCCSDKQGYMWFFTDRGASRYDGNTFTNYTTDNGLPDNFVNKYAFSPKGVLWVLGGLKQNKLAYFDGKEFVPFQYNNELQNKLKEELILNFSFEGEVPTYFGTRYLGLVYLNKKGQLEAQNNRPNTKKYRYDYYPDTKHQVIGAKDHLYPYIGKQMSYFINQCVFYNQVFNLSLDYSPTSYIYVHGDRLFFSFGYDLFIIKNNAIEKHKQFASNILNYYLDKDSTLYVALDNNIGVEVYLHCDLNHKQKTIFNDIRTTSINQDREGGFWITSHNSGIYYIPSFALQEIKLPFLQEHEIPAGIQVTNTNKLYVGLHNFKVYTMQNNSWSGNLYSEEQLNTIKAKYSIYGNVNFKNNGNLKQIKYLPKQQIIQPFYSGASLSIDENTGKLGIFVYGEDGIMINDTIKLCIVQKWLRRYYNNGKSEHQTDLKSERGFCIYKTKNKRILIGTQNGVEEFTHDTTRFVYHDTIKSRVTQIAELADSTLVFSTLGSGLYFYKKDSLLLNFKFPERYKRFNFIPKMVLDNNILYLATPEGIAIVKAHFPQLPSYQFITFSSGFLSNDIKDITVRDSMLYFLSGGRVVSVNTQAYTDNTTPPPIFITHCTIDTVDATAKMNPEISEKQRIKIEFATLLFRANNNGIYQYRLLGNNDSTWRTTTQAFIEFTSLLAGEYTFEVKALNENNIASIQTARYRFVVLAPIWKRPWFMFMAGILMALITYLIYRRQIAINNEKNKIRELMLSYEQQALAAQINPHFIFNVITNIQSFVLTQDKKVAYNYLNKFARLMRLSLDNSRLKWVSLQSEIELVHIYLDLEKLRFARFKFRIICDQHIDQKSTYVPSMLIQPFLENSVKHGIFYLEDKEGVLNINFEKVNDDILCTIEDNGVGRRIAAEKRPIHKEHRSAGQSITNKRMELLMQETGQKFYFEILDKQQDSGTIVRFNIPYKISFQKMEEID